MEIERKYLIDSLPSNLDSHPHVEIEQGYLCTTPTLRVRRMGAQCFLTVKESRPAEAQAIFNREEEFELPHEAYNSLLAKCDGRVVTKTRYYLPLESGLTAELDIFHGRHEGLFLVEVEFPNAAAVNNFRPPSWFGADVSADHRYTNAYLASNPVA